MGLRLARLSKAPLPQSATRRASTIGVTRPTPTPRGPVISFGSGFDSWSALFDRRGGVCRYLDEVVTLQRGGRRGGKGKGKGKGKGCGGRAGGGFQARRCAMFLLLRERRRDIIVGQSV